MLKKFAPPFTESNQDMPVNGFTLVELMVVLVVIGILATGIIMMFSNPVAKVKAAAFEMRGDFNLAKAISVKENESVLVDFNTGANNEYRVCFDTTDDGTCYDGGDEIIKTVIFRDRVTYYQFVGGSFPASGPDEAPDGTALPDPMDGTTFGGHAIEFQSNGTCDQPGVVIIYLSLQGSPNIIKGKPYALVVDSASTGRAQLLRWRQDYSGGANDGAWSRK